MAGSLQWVQSMRPLKRDGKEEEAFRTLKMCEDRGDPTGFRLIDEWETDGDLQRYFSKEGSRILLGALRTLRTEAEVE